MMPHSMYICMPFIFEKQTFNSSRAMDDCTGITPMILVPISGLRIDKRGLPCFQINHAAHFWLKKHCLHTKLIDSRTLVPFSFECLLEYFALSSSYLTLLHEEKKGSLGSHSFFFSFLFCFLYI